MAFSAITRDILEAETKEIFAANMQDLFSNTLKLDAKSIFKSASFEEIEGKMCINKVPFNEAEFHLRSGRINEFLKEVKISDANFISPDSEKVIRTTVLKDAPEVRIADLEGQYADLQKQVKELDVKTEELEKLGSTLKEKVCKFAKKAGWISAASLLAGLTAAGVELSKEMKKMKGCYIYQTLDGHISKFKIISRTCKENRELPHKIAEYPHTDRLKYNLNLLIRATTSDESKLSSFKEKIGIDDLSNNNIPNIIKTKKKDVEKFFNNNNVIITNPFELLTEAEKKDRVCIACNPSAPIDSVDFVDTTDLPINQAYHCEANPTLLETFVQFAGDSIHDLIEDVTGALGLRGILSYIASFIIIVIVIVLIGQYVISRYGHLLPAFIKNKIKPEENDIEMKPFNP